MNSSLRPARHTVIPTIIRDIHGNIADWNTAAEKRYGFSKGQAVGTVSHRLLRTVFPCPLSKINEELLESNSWTGELIHTVRDGARVKVLSRWELYFDEQGKPKVREINDSFLPVEPETAQLSVPSHTESSFSRIKQGRRFLLRIALFTLPALVLFALVLIAMNLPSSFAPISPH